MILEVVQLNEFVMWIRLKKALIWRVCIVILNLAGPS